MSPEDQEDEIVKEDQVNQIQHVFCLTSKLHMNSIILFFSGI